jgi:sugar phosphate permease
MNNLGPSPARMWRKIYWRTIPILGIAWLCCSIDRVNLGYVAVPLSKELGLSTASIGFAAGLVYLGYIVIPIPGNLIAYRVGARIWITRILIAWALITAAAAAVDSAATLYLARLLLGFAEAGLPAFILFDLTSWMPVLRSPGPCRTSSCQFRSPPSPVPYWRVACSAMTGWFSGWRAGGPSSWSKES